MVMLCGGGILPLIQAFIVDLSGFYLLSFILVLILLIYILWYSISGYKIKENSNVKVHED